MKQKWMTGLGLILALAMMLAACGNQGAAPQGNDGKPNAALEAAAPIALEKDADGDAEIMSTGPHGEAAVAATTLELTAEEVEKLREGNYKAAIVLHYAGNDWSTAQLDGLKTTFAKMGIEVIAETDAQFKSEKQVSDIETVMARKPDVIIGLPVDPVSTAGAFKKAAEAGAKIVFMDNVADGLEHGTHYASVVSADNYGNGVKAADILAEKLGGKGKIGVIYHDADFFVTKQRVEAFEQTMKEKYPEIEIVARGGIVEPSDGEKVASALLTKHPDLDGMFVVWDVPAEGALAAVRTAGKKDLVITTSDLGTNVALEIAKDGIVKGLGSERPYDQGVAEAILAGYALLGKETPSYVVVPPLGVTKDNVLEGWKSVYRQEAPDLIKNALK
ncbi:substrate-binding domain-containing protein [Paenibacillus sp. MSJ-34]|uniref:substrate-binding domain-containing protein n=1 Tax=Paenibacillus sp. MSJ-34 TaxID=2841529 RepID=UPI001C116F58|nr:substrate-binding domain-containing protein [Paenibacillus sp. MSJ-34]MBU5442550.1 substrate-binding domain-containing protein [Paenibacillus sp. MSJ-34]